MSWCHGWLTNCIDLLHSVNAALQTSSYIVFLCIYWKQSRVQYVIMLICELEMLFSYSSHHNIYILGLFVLVTLNILTDHNLCLLGVECTFWKEVFKNSYHNINTVIPQVLMDHINVTHLVKQIFIVIMINVELHNHYGNKNA